MGNRLFPKRQTLADRPLDEANHVRKASCAARAACPAPRAGTPLPKRMPTPVCRRPAPAVVAGRAHLDRASDAPRDLGVPDRCNRIEVHRRRPRRGAHRWRCGPGRSRDPGVRPPSCPRSDQRLGSADADHSLSRKENQIIASTRSGHRSATPPGKRGVGTLAIRSNRPACPWIASAASFPPSVAIATPCPE